jgi:pimeloyl-ACP methyl ester carboxylesterase
MNDRKGAWYWIRRVWATLGILALLGFAGWSFVAYRASDDTVGVVRGGHHWLLAPKNTSAQKVALLFFPGALVEPAAYGPLLRKIVLAGYTVLLVEVPHRGAFGGADGAEVISRARLAMLGVSGVSEWVIAGHSRGGAVAARFVRESPAGVRALILVGTSHPRDFSLAESTLSVTKILGTRDGVAPLEKSEDNRHLLPARSRWVLIEGGNHSQFGSYGFQPGDHFASIDRDLQQRLTSKAIVDALESVARGNTSANKAIK